MAITLTAPATSENDNIVVVLRSNEGRLFGINTSDFTLRRTDNDTSIGANISIGTQQGSGRNFTWDITVDQTDAYRGEVYLQVSANAFNIISGSRLVRTPQNAVNSNNFRFRVVPAPDAPTNFAGTVTFESARLTWTSDATKTYEIRRDSGAWADATSPLDVTGLSPETSYNWELRVKEDGLTPPSDAVSLTLTTPVAPPRPAAPANFSVVVTSVAARAMWEELPGETYEVRQDSGEWEDADSPHLFMGLTPNDKYTFQVRVRANAGVRAGAVASITITTLSAGALAIELIAEQFILVRTRNYSLEIDIYGNPDTAEVSGLQEGFYQDWDGTNNKLYIKSESVDRLTMGAVWTVTARKGSEVVTATIIYNVTEAVPVIIDPGAFTLYQDFDFDEFVRVRNAPTIVTGYSTLVGLKSQPATLEIEGQEPLSGISTNGRLLSTARIPFDQFNIDYYAENEHGSDELSVPVDIMKGTFYRGTLNYVARTRTVSLTMLLPNNVVPDSTFEITPTVDVGGDSIAVRYTGRIRLRNGVFRDHDTVVFSIITPSNPIRAVSSGIPADFLVNRQRFEASYTDDRNVARTLLLSSAGSGGGFTSVSQERDHFEVSSSQPVTFTLPDGSTLRFTSPTSTSTDPETGRRLDEITTNVSYSLTRQSVVQIPAGTYGVEGYTGRLIPIGRGFTVGIISFAFTANGRTQNMVFRNFNIRQDYNNTVFTRIT